MNNAAKLLTLAGALAVSILGVGAAQAQSVANEGCMPIAQVRDTDISRNADILAMSEHLCLSEIEFDENGLDWRLTVIDNTKHTNGPTIFLLHDNENSAFDTALYSIRKYGGKIVAVEASDKRVFHGVQDPNRNFGTSKSSTKSCRDMRTKPSPIFSQIMLDLRHTRANFFLTLHNNANGHSGNGGSGGISAKRNSRVMNGLLAPNGGDEDDAVLLAGTTPFEEDRKAKKAAAYFHKAGVNVIYEHVTPAGNDCSFSNFVVLNQLGRYFNIEAQHGHFDQQKHMLDVFMKFHLVKARDKSVE